MLSYVRRLVIALGAVVVTAAQPVAGQAGDSCQVGAWFAPGTGQQVGHAAIVSEAARFPVVLLGETHDNPEHHRWQFSVLASLRGQRNEMILGFEAFPRRAQPVLDRWVEGELSETAFLKEVDWWRVWGFDPSLYMPLMHFARLHRIPVVALNVDRSFVGRVADDGWEAIPEAERLGLSTPALPDEAYVDVLAESYIDHVDSDDATIEEVRQLREFERFVQAQLTWDRAMAEAIVDNRSRSDSPLFVGIIGSGHLRHRHGVPHQLADLGIEDAMVLLPHEVGVGCADLEPRYADAVFPLADPGEDQKPRLGVSLTGRDDGVTVSKVLGGSVAAAAGMQQGDVIVRAGGQTISMVGELAGIIRRQLPGTWLPIDVRRGDRALQLVAKFPTVETAS